MIKATSLLTALGLGLSTFSVASTPARAGGEGVAAGIIGFAAGAIVGSQLNRQRAPARTYRSAPRQPSMSAEERQYWKNVQASLNAVGLDAGPVDGAPGRRTRSAIKDFQLSINAAPDGKLTPQQASMLFARASGQPLVGAQPAYGMMPAGYGQPNLTGQGVYPMPPAGYQQQPAANFPNVTLPANTTVPGVAPVPAGTQPLTFPAAQTAQDAPNVEAPVQMPAFPAVTVPQGATAVAAVPAVPAVPAGTQPVAFPPAQTAQSAPQGVQPAAAPAFPAIAPVTMTASAAPAQVPVVEAPAAPSSPIAFPPVDAAQTSGTAEPVVAAASAEAPAQGSFFPVANAAPAAVAPAPALQAQPQIQVDENGQQFIMMNGQKFLLKAE